RQPNHHPRREPRLPENRGPRVYQQGNRGRPGQAARAQSRARAHRRRGEGGDVQAATREAWSEEVRVKTSSTTFRRREIGAGDLSRRPRLCFFRGLSLGQEGGGVVVAGAINAAPSGTT